MEKHGWPMIHVQLQGLPANGQCFKRDVTLVHYLVLRVHGCDCGICKIGMGFVACSNPPRPIRLILSLMHHTVAVCCRPIWPQAEALRLEVFRSHPRRVPTFCHVEFVYGDLEGGRSLILLRTRGITVAHFAQMCTRTVEVTIRSPTTATACPFHAVR